MSTDDCTKQWIKRGLECHVAAALEAHTRHSQAAMSYRFRHGDGGGYWNDNQGQDQGQCQADNPVLTVAHTATRTRTLTAHAQAAANATFKSTEVLLVPCSAELRRDQPEMTSAGGWCCNCRSSSRRCICSLSLSLSVSVYATPALALAEVSRAATSRASGSSCTPGPHRVR